MSFAIMVFIELYKTILLALDGIIEWDDIETSSKAKWLMTVIEQPEFNFYNTYVWYEKVSLSVYFLISNFRQNILI